MAHVVDCHYEHVHASLQVYSEDRHAGRRRACSQVREAIIKRREGK